MTIKKGMRDFAGVTAGIAFGSLLWIALFAWFGVWR